MQDLEGGVYSWAVTLARGRMEIKSSLTFTNTTNSNIFSYTTKK